MIPYNALYSINSKPIAHLSVSGFFFYLMKNLQNFRKQQKTIGPTTFLLKVIGPTTIILIKPLYSTKA